MKRILKNIYVMVSTIRLIPLLIFYMFSKNRAVISYEVERWCHCYNLICRRFSIVWLLTYYKEFRSLVYYRIPIARLVKFLAPPMTNLYIYCEKIGKGLFIQHGFSTVISAKSIGENCWINQQVTIGWSSGIDAPIIGDNVSIYAGAIIVGRVNVGDNVKIGAGAVVVKDVPNNSTVVGAPSRTILRDIN